MVRTINYLKIIIANNWLEAKSIFLTVYSLASLFVVAGIYKNFNSHSTLISLKTIIFTYLFATLLFFLYLKLIDRNKKLIERKVPNPYSHIDLTNTRKQLKYTGVIIVSLISFFIFINNGPTAFEWPGIDMGPFFERSTNSSFAINDFFTNTSSLPNPRHIFGNLVLKINDTLNTDWYSTYFLLKIILVVFTPALLFLTLKRSLYKRLTDDPSKIFATLLLIFAVCLVFIDRINGIFSIGWWTPYNLIVMPQTLSLLIGLIFSYSALKTKTITLIPLLLISTLIHPAMGIFIFWFFILMDFDKKQIKYYLKLLIFAVCLPILYIAYKFSSVTSLSSSDFVYHYIYENHSFHYLPSMLGNFTSFPWYVSFSLINILFLVLVYFGFKFKDNYLKILSLISLFSYSGALFMQYVFVELFPIKTIATIGPIRFTLFGYWILVFLFIYVIASYIPKTFYPIIQDKIYINKKLLPIILLFLIASYIGIGYAYKDNPVQTFSKNYPNLIQWIDENVPTNNVMAAFPNFPPSSVPLILKRSVYFGNGFPFTEDGFLENDLRKELIFGLEENKKIQAGLKPYEKTTDYYRSLKPNDFIVASKKFRLDYIIIESKFSENFSNYKPEFENEKIKIYKISDLSRQ